MGLYEKIEEIRSKPEHIRMRYVWAMVAITMIFVIAIWFFSLVSSKNAEPLTPGETGDSDIVNQIKKQNDSLKNETNEEMDSAQQQKSAVPQDNLQQDIKNNQ